MKETDTLSKTDLEIGMAMLEDDKQARALRKSNAIANRQEHEQKFTDMIIEALESGSPLGKWSSGHSAGNAFGGLPINYTTRNHYRGVNVLMLHFTAMGQGWGSQWATRKQWLAVLERAHNLLFKKVPRDKWPSTPEGIMSSVNDFTPVVFYKPLKGKLKDKATGKLTDKDGWIPMMRFYALHNINQIEWPKYIQAALGWKEVTPPTPEEQEVMAQEIVDKYCSHYGVTVEYRGSRSYNQDSGGPVQKGLVVVPERKFFEDARTFWAHLFHEIVHSTGHKLRLNRPKASNWASWTPDDYEKDEFWESLEKDESYAREELVAEMGAGMLCMMVGWEYDTRHAQYLQSWLSALKSDTSMVIKMATAAQKAIDMILDTKFKNSITTALQIVPTYTPAEAAIVPYLVA